MYRWVLRKTSAVLIIGALVLGGIGAAQAVGDQAHYSDKYSQHIQDEKLARFYGMIDGTENAIGPTVDASLAAELRQRLGPIDPQARSLPDEITRFRSSNNVYGGITDTIGQDPFTNSGCNECGALTAEVKTNLLQIKQGNGLRVQDKYSTPQPQHRYRFTVFGLSVLAELLLFWLVLATIVVAILMRQAPEKDPEPGLIQEHEAQNVLWVIAPLYFALATISQHVAEARFEKQVRRKFPEPMAIVDDVERKLRHTHDPHLAQQALEAKNAVIEELRNQTGHDGGTGDDMQLTALVEQLKSTQGFLKARSETLHEFHERELNG